MTLSVGDKVIVKRWGYDYALGEILRLTPKQIFVQIISAYDRETKCSRDSVAPFSDAFWKSLTILVDAGVKLRRLSSEIDDYASDIFDAARNAS